MHSTIESTCPRSLIHRILIMIGIPVIVEDRHEARSEEGTFMHTLILFTINLYLPTVLR
jgi:hypothetical protein